MTFSARVFTLCFFSLKCSVRRTMFLPQTKDVCPSFSMKYPVGISLSFGCIPNFISLSNNWITVMIPPFCGLPGLIVFSELSADFQSYRRIGFKQSSMCTKCFSIPSAYFSLFRSSVICSVTPFFLLGAFLFRLMRHGVSYSASTADNPSACPFPIGFSSCRLVVCAFWKYP